MFVQVNALALIILNGWKRVGRVEIVQINPLMIYISH